MIDDDKPIYLSEKGPDLNGPGGLPVPCLFFVLFCWVCGEAGAAERAAVDRMANSEKILVDESLEIVGWEMVPESVYAVWQNVPHRERERLQKIRELEPGVTYRVDVLWHVLTRLQDTREVEVELVQRSNLIARRSAISGKTTAWGQADLLPERLLKASYAIPVQYWPQETPIEVRLVLHYGDPVRPAQRISLGLFRITSLGGVGQRAVILARGGNPAEAAPEIRNLFASEASIGAVPSCLCDLEFGLFPEEEARCQFLRGNRIGGGRSLLQAAWKGIANQKSYAFAWVEAGHLAWKAQDSPEAAALYRSALRLKPDLAEAALGLERMGSPDAGEASRSVRRLASWVVPGRSWVGKHGASLYTNGPAFLHFMAVAGRAEISIDVWGEPAGGQAPRLRARLDRQLLGEIHASQEKGAKWVLETPLRAGENILQIDYLNDFRIRDEDRNAYLGDVRIRYLPEDGGK